MFYNPKSKVINTSAEFARNWQFLIQLVNYSGIVVMVCSMKQDRYVHTLLCSLQPLDCINPPFQTGFTFHHFINRLSGVGDEMSIHSRE